MITNLNMNRRLALKLMGSAAVSAPFIGKSHAATKVELISHRYPALEFYAEQFKTALPGVDVNAQLMPVDKQIEMATITLSSQSSAIDLVYVNNATISLFASKGWLRPLDKYWEKYKAEFNLGDFNPAVLAEYQYKGETYAIPGNSVAAILAYRKDLFDKAGVAAPKTMEEYVSLAQKLHTPARAGTVLSLKPGDGVYSEVHWHLNAEADGWFDDKWRPIFNSPRGVKAVETVKTLTKYAPPGFTAAFTDETTILLQQDAANMGMSWSTRAQTFDDPAKSLVKGKMEFVGLPGGGGRRNSDGYSISAFSKQDPDTMFRLIATTISEQNQRKGAKMLVPTRMAVLNDPVFAKEYRHYPASLKALETGKPLPPLPEIYAVGEFISRRIGQAVTGEMPVKDALDAAAKETEAFLARAGYYKS